VTDKRKLAEELRSYINELAGLQGMALEHNAYAESGNGAHFWRAYLAARGLGLRTFPEEWLKKLDQIVPLILAARTDSDLWKAVELARPLKGGPGRPALAQQGADGCALRVAIWAEHLKRSCETYDRNAGIPDRLAPGTYDAVAMLHGRSADALKVMWSRWKRAGAPDRESVGSHLADLMMKRRR